MKKDRDYIAKMVVYGIDTMGTAEIERLRNWLDDFSNDLRIDVQRRHLHLYYKKFTKRLMK